ncbi:hypothetical protein DDT91_20370 [Algoriphagus sp. AK58]|nr:hypothetical protein [Algoriphagus sp. AK58]
MKATQKGRDSLATKNYFELCRRRRKCTNGFLIKDIFNGNDYFFRRKEYENLESVEYGNF